MKRIIRLTESELVSLVKRSILETKNNEDMKTWGCNLFPKNSEEREWCECAGPRIKDKKRILIQKVRHVVQLLKRGDFSDLSQRSLKFFNSQDPFFKERSEKFIEVRDILYQYCKKAEKSVAEFRKDIMNDAVFIEKKDDKDEYSLLNKLNTNYTAVAYLLTIFRRQNNLVGKPFDEVFNEFFENSTQRMNRGDETRFTNFMINFLSNKEDEVNIMKEVFKTIQATTDIGLMTETDAYKFLESKYGTGNVLNYSGDYSFVDLFGIDFMVKGVEGHEDKFIPVQVKTNPKHLGGNDRVCVNVAMAKDDTRWVMNLYDGKYKIKTLL